MSMINKMMSKLRTMQFLLSLISTKLVPYIVCICLDISTTVCVALNLAS